MADRKGDELNEEQVATTLKQAEGGPAAPECEAKSIMYTGGTIRTIEGGAVDKVVEAIGFLNGKVLAVGTTDEVKAEMDRACGGVYATVCLSEGHTLLPGFIDPHVHIPMSGMMMAGMNDFGPFEGQYLRERYDPEWLKEKISDAKKGLKSGFWLLGHSVDPALMPFVVSEGDGLHVLQRLDVDIIDQVESDVPVLILSTGHSAYVNTVALKMIYETIKPSSFDTFEKFRESVNANGGLQEIDQIFPALTALPPNQFLDTMMKIGGALDTLFETANQRGITFLNDAAMSSNFRGIVDPYLAKNPPRVRIGYAQLCNSLEEVQALDPYKPLTDLTYFFQSSVKIISDGSNQGLTGFQKEPYRCKPEGNTGISNFEVDELEKMLKVVIKDKKWPVLVHANGNGAIENVLTAFEGALDGESGLTKRHRIEHCSLLSEDAMQKMSDLGLSPSFLIGHVSYWGNVFKTGIFEEKTEILDPCKSALGKGMRISLHSDFWVTPLGPLRMMEQAITRIMERDPDGKVLNEGEKLTPAQALRAVTYDAAWQCQVDKWVGSLEAGKMADYVILAEDPITRKDPVGMRNIPVLETWLGGVKVGQFHQQ